MNAEVCGVDIEVLYAGFMVVIAAILFGGDIGGDGSGAIARDVCENSTEEVGGEGAAELFADKEDNDPCEATAWLTAA